MALMATNILSAQNVPFGPGAGKTGFRHLLQMLGVQEGVVAADDYKPTQRAAGGANKSIDVAAGDAWIKGDDTARQGFYEQPNDATVNVITPDNASGSPRFDQLVVRAYDSAIAGVSDTPQFEVIQGTPNASTTPDNRLGAAALPNNAMRIAEWVAPSGYTAITDAMLRDRRPRALGMIKRLTANAGPFTSSGTPTLIDAANLQPRIECSGVPLLITLTMQASFSIDERAAFGLMVDGGAVQNDAHYLRTQPSAVDKTWTYVPPVGSLLIGPTMASFAAGTVTINSASGQRFLVRELT